jgi:hypothetical protein
VTRDDLSQIADLIVRDVCELPDRTSPDDWPEALLVTSEELHTLIVEQFAEAFSTPSPDTGAVAPSREALLELADKIERQVPVTRSYLADNGLDDHFSDILLSHYLDFAREARAAITAEPKASAAVGWMPIASAPKDGTWFIALQDGELYPCQWHAEEPDEGPYQEGWWDHFNKSFEEPTRWIPLPAPPSTPDERSLTIRGDV